MKALDLKRRAAHAAAADAEVAALRERVAELETAGPEWALDQLAFAKQRVTALEADAEALREQVKALADALETLLAAMRGTPYARLLSERVELAEAALLRAGLRPEALVLKQLRAEVSATGHVGIRIENAAAVILAPDEAAQLAAYLATAPNTATRLAARHAHAAWKLWYAVKGRLP